MRHQRAAVLLAILISALVASKASAFTITVDGDPSDWALSPPQLVTETLPHNVNVGHINRAASGAANHIGEYAWLDASGDERTNFSNSAEVDLLSFHITSDASNLYFRVHLRNISHQTGNDAPQVQIAMDTGIGGETWLGSECDTHVSADAAWEYLVVTSFGSGSANPKVYDTNFTDLNAAGAIGAVQDIDQGLNTIEIAVPWSGIGNVPIAPIKFTVVTLRANATDIAWDISGNSDVLDVLTNYGHPGCTVDPNICGISSSTEMNTWHEFDTDGEGTQDEDVVDYHFAVWFHLDPEVEPASPVLISEVLYNPAGVEPNAEWIELFNATGYPSGPALHLDLAGFRLGDEETVLEVSTEDDGMHIFPTGAAIAPGQSITIANDGYDYFNTFGRYPNYELYGTATLVHNLAADSNWAAESVVLRNSNSDEVLLIDNHFTIIDVVTWQGSDYPGVIPWGSVSNGHSLARLTAYIDSNDCNADLDNDSSPEPFVVAFPCTDPFGGNIETDTACSNGDPCTVAACDGAASCIDAAPLSCPDDGNACTDDICDNIGVLGCYPPAALGTSCDDGLYCTGALDTCDGLGACSVSGEDPCDDSVGCTDDVCDENGDSCSNTANDENCDNNVFCDGVETCDQALDCQAGTAPDCADAITCTVDSCDAVSDTCIHVPDDSECDDGTFCNGAETCDLVLDCQNGAAPDCADTVDCTTDSCDAASDTCIHVPNDSACDDGTYCNGVEVCDLVLGCQDGADPSCEDAVACTDDSCDAVSDTCVHLPNDVHCDNGQYCDGAETCHQTLGCQNGADPCAGADVCNNTCNEAEDNCFSPNTTACDDLLYCTLTDLCDGSGTCAGSGDPCAGGDVCNNSCNEADNNCLSDSTTQCDDNDDCTEDDLCNSGICAGSAISGCQPCEVPGDCDDNNDCTTEDCVSDVCIYTNVNDTSVCDDGVYCNGADTCLGGVCSQHGGNPCSAGEECNNSCNETEGNCYVAAAVACSSDDNPCTIDQCDGAGACGHAAGNPGVECRPAAGICDVAEACDGTSTTCPTDNFVAVSIACDDSDNCTTGTECDGLGNCSGGINVCADAGTDAGLPDVDTADAGVDGGVPDVAGPDAFVAGDAAVPVDAVSPDTASPDTASPDTASPDTASPDTASPDTATVAVDAGGPPRIDEEEGCGCVSATPTGGLALPLLALAMLLWRRRLG